MENEHVDEWASAAVRELLERCMRAVALQLEDRARQVRIELARRGVGR